MCATHTVTKSSQQVILNEVTRGFEITAAIMDGKKPWSALFAKNTFFTMDYKYYITVISSAISRDAHASWAGKVESRVRFLVSKLEHHPSIKLARPFTVGFKRKHICTEDQVAQVMGGSLAYVVKDVDKPDTTQDTESSPSADVPSNMATVYTTTHYIGLDLKEGRLFTPIIVLAVSIISLGRR